MSEKIKKTLRLGSHYRMERFTVLFMIYMVCIVLVIGGCFAVHMNKQKDTMSTKALYNTKFTTSRTNLAGSMDGVYVNKNHTKAFIIWHYDNADSISTDANQYRAFATAVTKNLQKKTLKTTLDASFYSFGTSGYQGLFVTAADGFQPEITKFTVRNGKELVSNEDGTTAEENMGDSSYEKYDQFDIYVNLCGSDAKVIDALDKRTLTPTILYEEIISRVKEKEIRKTLDSDLENLRVGLNEIDEYNGRLRDYGIRIPTLPASVSGDSVKKDKDGNLTLKTDYVCAGGFDFDWRSGSISKGYLDKLRGDQSVDSYLNKKSLENNQNEFTVGNIEWSMDDGTLLSEMAPDSQRYKGASEVISKWTSAVSNYYSSKKQYQVTDLRSLLELEESLTFIDMGQSVNTKAKFLLTY